MLRLSPTGRSHLAVTGKMTLLVAHAAYYVCQRRKAHRLFFLGVALRRFLLVVRLNGLKAAVDEATVHSIRISRGLGE